MSCSAAGRAPRATHFYLFCLVSFALYALKYTGATGPAGPDGLLDEYRGGVAAARAVSAFCLEFPGRAAQRLRRTLAVAACVCAGRRRCSACGSGRSANWQATGLLKHRLDQTGTAYEAVFYVLGAALFLAATAGYDPAAAPAAEVADARSAAGGGSLHPVLRGAVPVRPAPCRDLFTNLPGFSWYFFR